MEGVDPPCNVFSFSCLLLFVSSLFLISFYVLHRVRYRELHSSTTILFGLQRPWQSVEGKSLCEKEIEIDNNALGYAQVHCDL